MIIFKRDNIILPFFERTIIYVYLAQCRCGQVLQLFAIFEIRDLVTLSANDTMPLFFFLSPQVARRIRFRAPLEREIVASGCRIDLSGQDKLAGPIKVLRGAKHRAETGPRKQTRGQTWDLRAEQTVATPIGEGRIPAGHFARRNAETQLLPGEAGRSSDVRMKNTR